MKFDALHGLIDSTIININSSSNFIPRFNCYHGVEPGTVCPRSLDPIYIVIYYINGSRLLGHKVQSITSSIYCVFGITLVFIQDGKSDLGAHARVD